MNKKNKVIVSLLFLMLTFILVGCNKSIIISSYSEMDKIIYKGVLKNEGNYLVFIYGDTCTACEELEPTLAKYATLAKNKSSKYDAIYVLNSSNTRVNSGLISSNDDSYNDFKGTTSYSDIHIATTPALLVIKNHRVEKYISTKNTTKPKTEIKEYFTGLMK